MSHLFAPLTLRSVTLANRIVMAPMGQGFSENGFTADWHLVHLGSRAVGGAGLVMAESTAITPEGRMGPRDLGIWSDDHGEGLRRITRFIDAQGSVAGIQLSHAGRLASTFLPGRKVSPITESEGGWHPAGPSAIPYGDEFLVPAVLTGEDIAVITQAYANAARRACNAGFRVLEINAGQGFLLHQFLSPLSNIRDDAYGGSFSNRTRFLHEVVEAVRSEWPGDFPLFVRINDSDGVAGGWDIDQAVALARDLSSTGVDLIDCASGSVMPGARSPKDPDDQHRFTERVRREGKILTGAVGMITSAEEADRVLGGSKADCVLMARELLRDPYWPLRAAQALGDIVPWPDRYLAAAPQGTPPRSDSPRARV